MKPQKNMDEKSIESQAQEIMDNFFEAMKDIEVEEDFIAPASQSYREESEGKKGDEEYKERFLKNAPHSKGDAIVANKGSWL